MKRFVLVLSLLILSACAPMMIQAPRQPSPGFLGPRFETDTLVSFDGARLGLITWAAADPPWAVIIGLHGMNDYANAFHIAAPRWAKAGITTYAYDQRGFGVSPGRGVWAGEDLMVEDLRTVVALARARHPQALIVVAGESMGGSVAAAAFAGDNPPAADRLVLMSPAVWGFGSQPLPNKTLLWLAANLTPSKVYTPPKFITSRITPTDNRQELIAMGRDPLMIWGARSDTLLGLVRLMSDAASHVGEDDLPTLYLAGANDQIIPRKATLKAVKNLGPADRTADYAAGYHLLTRDLQGQVVIDDILSFIRDPAAPLPSGAPPIPGAPQPIEPSGHAAGL